MIKTLLDLLMENVQHLYSSEDYMLQQMPFLVEKVNHSSLKNALNHHLSLTEKHKERLLEVAKTIRENKREQVNLNSQPVAKGIMGLLEEAKALLEKGLEKDVVDAAIIAAIQKMEHYEISGYGTALAYARQLHIPKAEALLTETLDEEYDADDLLTALATASFNKEAIHEDIKRFDEAGDHSDNSNDDTSKGAAQVRINERTINSPGGRAGTSHRRYGTGESRGH